jgi:hypothetical protein
MWFSVSDFVSTAADRNRWRNENGYVIEFIYSDKKFKVGTEDENGVVSFLPNLFPTMQQAVTYMNRYHNRRR